MAACLLRVVVVGALLLVGVVGCSDDDSGSAPVAEGPSSTVVEESSGVEDGEDGSGSGGQVEPGWQVSDLPGVDEPAAVAATDGAMVVVTWGSSRGLRSSDGDEWEQVEVFPEVEFSEQPPAVTGGPLGFVAVATENGAVPNTPVVVFSPDSVSWERIDAEELPSEEVSWLTDVVAGSVGFLITGRAVDMGEGNLVWFSPDGRTWTETDLPAFDGEVALASHGSGFAALGPSGRFPYAADLPARVWTSADGTSWSQVESDSAPPTEALAAYVGAAPLAVDGDTWVLAPVEAQMDPTVWVSTDTGVTWAEVSLTDDPGVVYSITDMVTTAHGFVGALQDDAFGRRSAMVFAHDGISWQVSPAISEVGLVAPFGEKVVSVGGDEVAIWHGPE